MFTKIYPLRRQKDSGRRAGAGGLRSGRRILRDRRWDLENPPANLTQNQSLGSLCEMFGVCLVCYLGLVICLDMLGFLLLLAPGWVTFGCFLIGQTIRMMADRSSFLNFFERNGGLGCCSWMVGFEWFWMVLNSKKTSSWSTGILKPWKLPSVFIRFHHFRPPNPFCWPSAENMLNIKPTWCLEVVRLPTHHPSTCSPVHLLELP